MPAPNFFSGMTTLQILKAVIGLGSDVQTGSIFPTWSDTVEYCKPDTFWFHEGYLYQSLKESGLQSENGTQIPLSNFEYWKKISYTPLHMGEDELEILNELNTLRISRIGAPQWATSAIAPDDHVFANGDLVYFSDRPELEEKYLSGGFDGMLLAWDATAAQQNANRGMFRPNAASPTGLYMPVDGNAYMQNWVNATNGTPGSFISAGLPNIVGYFGADCVNSGIGYGHSGAFSASNGSAFNLASGDSYNTIYRSNFSAAASNQIYGASTTVTPDTIKQPVIIYLGRADKILSITTKDKNWAATETEIGFGRVSTLTDLTLPADQIIDGPAFFAVGTDAAIVLSETAGCTADIFGSFADTRPGCLLMNGAEVSRTTYARLFGVLGTAFGAGNGTTTFKLPDARGRTLQGANGNLLQYLAAKLPNIRGNIGPLLFKGDESLAVSGALSVSAYGGLGAATTGNNVGRLSMDFNAGVYNAIYSGTTVQSPAITVNWFIKY